ncbi:MAG: sigma-70 family RNA polymerase sigma factor [Pirellulales bacterium]|nr:sigma-70 family RNA polymerase sigma factor [Pirellulales bacterium]
MSASNANTDSAQGGASFDPADHGEFLRLYSTYQRNVFAYISTLLPNATDVDDVLQETSIVLWKKFSTYRRDSDFCRWACGVAHYEVLRFRRQRPQVLPLEDHVLELIASQQLAMRDELDGRREALAYCVETLPAEDQQLLDLCYARASKSKDVAEQLNRPVSSVYQSLSRIRRALHDCVLRRLAAEGCS